MKHCNVEFKNTRQKQYETSIPTFLHFHESNLNNSGKAVKTMEIEQHDQIINNYTYRPIINNTNSLKTGHYWNDSESRFRA